MASPAAVLQILVTANTAAATASLARTDAQLKKTTASANTASTAMGSRMAGAAKMGAAAVGVGLVYAMGKAVKVGADFEKQMDAVGAVADANAKQMKALEKQALSLGQKTQYSAMEVAAAQEQLVKGGLKLKDVLGGALPASLSLAAAGQMELADASTTTVNAMKLFGLEGKEAMNVADMLATAANKTTADVSDFAMALQQGGSAAKAAGYTLNDTITVLEALAEAGIKNSDAGTSMKTAFLQLLSPTEKQAELAEKLNLQLIDQNGNLKGAAGLSKELRDALGGMTNAQQAANLKLLAGTDGFRTLNALLEASPDKFREFTQANRENGTANDVAAKKMDNLAGSAEQLSGAVQTLAIKVSKWINPKLREAIDWMTGALTDLDKVGPGAAFGKKFVSAQEALFRSLGALTDDQLYDIVASWDAAGKTIRKDQVTHWLALNKISADEADQLFRMIDRFNQNSKDAFRLLAAYMRGTVTDGIKGFSTKTAGFLKDWSAKGQDAIQDLNKALGTLRDGYEKTGDKTKSATEKMAEAGKKMASSLKGSTANVTGSFNSMVNATGDGLRIMGKNVSKALSAVGVKKAVSFSIEKVGDAAKGFQKGGVIVPGQGDGDKVPALLEPGEVVLNKKAVAAMGGASRANSINRKIPRFAKGGVAGGLDFALGPYTVPPIQYAADHAGGNSHVHITGTTTPWVVAIGKQLQRMGMLVGEHPAFGGVAPPPSHSLTGGHYDALAIDVNDPSDNEPKSWVASIARILGGSGIAGAVAEKIARVILKGPDGPLKSIGQSALDKARDAANKYVASQAPSGVDVGVVGPGANIKNLPKSLEKYNHQWAYDSTDSIPPSAVKAMTRWQGLPSWFWKIAIGESNFQPGAVGHDPNGYSTGYGLFQETEPFANPYLRAVTGGLDFNDWLNPIINTMSARKHFDAASSQTPGTVGFPWYGTTGLQRGGIIQKFGKGGEAKKDKELHGSISGGKTDSAWRRFTRARKIADKLKKLLGPKGRIAKIDESIGIQETLAGLDSSPMGSELSKDELARQVALNERLLEVLVRARKLARSGLSEMDFPKGMSTTALGKTQISGMRGTFNTYLSDLTGVTGKGGRIFDTRVHLDALKHTAIGAGALSGMDISALRSVIEASRYGAFDGMFARGGSIRPGHWGIAGEAGPEIVHGPATVTPLSGGVNIQTSIDFDGLDAIVTHTVNGQLAKRERHHHRQARSYA